MNTKHGSTQRGSALSPTPAAAGLPAALARRVRAFTIVEIVIVLAILGALVALGAVSYTSIRNTAWDRATEARLSQMAKVGLGERVFSDASDGFQPDASDFTGSGSGANDVYKDMTFVSATTPSTEPGQVSLAIGDSSMQQAAVAYGAGDLAALASRSKSGKCSFAVMTKGGSFTAWTTDTDTCAAVGALRPLSGGGDTPAPGDAGAVPSPTGTASATTGTTPEPTSTTPDPDPTTVGAPTATVTGPPPSTTTTSPAPTGTTGAGTPTAPQYPLCGGQKATIIGTEGDDVIYGRGTDVILGLGGNDLIYLDNHGDIACGGDGNDKIIGGNGQDYIYGGPGDDTLLGGNGPDWIFGGDGNDVVDGERGQNGTGHIEQDGPNN